MSCTSPAPPGQTEPRTPALPASFAVPLAAPAERAPEPLPQPEPSASDEAVTPDALSHERLPSQELNLARFTPLLHEDGLQAARALCEEGRYEECVDSVRAVLTGRRLSALEQPRWWLLLGLLEERAKRMEAAQQEFARSAAVAWPLSDYARLGLGRTLIALGQPEAAQKELSGIVESGSTYPEASGLIAEASCARLRIEECTQRLDAYVAHPARPSGWARSGFQILQRLVASVVHKEPTASGKPPTEQQVLRVLRSLKKLSLLAPNTAASENAAQLQEQLLSQLSPDARQSADRLTQNQQLQKVRALSDAGRRSDTADAARAFIEQLGQAEYGPKGCEALYLWGKALTRTSDRREGIEKLATVGQRCKSIDRRAWALYLAGKYSYRSEEYTDAERYFSEVERIAPKHRLADDSRLYRALVSLDMGVEARFTELLSTIAEDYPQGDMSLDGVFRLALRSMERGDWAATALTLRKAIALVGDKDAERGQEWAGRERFFLARALIELGERDAAFAQYAGIIYRYPLSYYAIQAFTRLHALAPEQARFALDQALKRARQTPFSIQHRSEFEEPGFVRVLELLRVSEMDSARRELRMLKVSDENKNAVRWGTALLFAHAGSAHYSHAIPRWELKDWLEYWPAGGWLRAWQLAYPRPHSALVSKQARQQEVPEPLIYAVMREESGFNETALSGAGAYGLMQLILPTARHFGRMAGLPHDEHALTRPEINIALGSRVLASYAGRFEATDLLAVPAYNAGPGRPRRWLEEWPNVDFDIWVELIPFRETRRYTKRVLTSRATYRFLYYDYQHLEQALLLPTSLDTTRGT